MSGCQVLFDALVITITFNDKLTWERCNRIKYIHRQTCGEKGFQTYSSRIYDDWVVLENSLHLLTVLIETSTIDAFDDK